jgi:hypothetical protein
MLRGPRRELALLAVAFLASLPLVTPRIYASDEVQYFAYLRSLWFDGDLSFENEYRHFYDSGVMRNALFHETFLERRTEETGLRVTFATLGPALLWSPFYAVADVTTRARRAMGSTVAADGLSPPYVAAAAYGSAVYGWLAIVLGWWMTRRLLGHTTSAVVASLAVWVGTPLFFYMYIAPPMSHACSAFAVAAFLATWLRVRPRWSVAGCAALGALAALMAMVREQDAFIALGPIVDWAVFEMSRLLAGGSRLLHRGWSPRAIRHRLSTSDVIRRQPLIVSRILAAGAAFLATYSPQLWAYTVLNGYPGPSRLVARKMNWTSPHALDVLFSPQHGLLFWTPLIVLSLAGLVWLARARVGGAKAPPSFTAKGAPHALEAGTSAPATASAPATGRIGVCLLLAFASQVYVAGSVESWSVAGAFGQRRFVGLTAVFSVGLAALLMQATRAPARAGTLAATTLTVWWNLALIVQFGAGLMNRQRLELGRNAYQAFVTIPARLPDLAYRYVFERRSFYKGSREP